MNLEQNTDNLTFNVGDMVKYGALGECKIADRRIVNLAGREREVFVLNQIKDGETTIYVPIEKATTFKPLHPPMTMEEIIALHDIEPQVIDEQLPDAKRDALFKETIARGKTEEIVAVLKGIYKMQGELKPSRRKLRPTETNAMKIFERMLYDEFSRTVKIRLEDVPAIIVTGNLPCKV
jgi:RNA polymerase-interacting CarD/CdnL/TRCF family regulator